MKKEILNKVLVISIAIIGILLIIIATTLTSLLNNKLEPVEIIIEEIKYDTEPIQYEVQVLEKIDYESIRIQNYYKDLQMVDEIKNTSSMEWFKEYKKISDQYSDVVVRETIYESLSLEDIEYLQRMVETECYGGDFDSKTHVAAVALSRVISERFPNTLKDVITKPNQFCYGRKNISEDTILACEYAFEIGTEVDGCLFFHSGQWSEKFNGADYVITDKIGHHFYL